MLSARPPKILSIHEAPGFISNISCTCPRIHAQSWSTIWLRFVHHQARHLESLERELGFETAQALTSAKVLSPLFDYSLGANSERSLYSAIDFRYCQNLPNDWMISWDEVSRPALCCSHELFFLKLHWLLHSERPYISSPFLQIKQLIEMKRRSLLNGLDSFARLKHVDVKEWPDLSEIFQ